MHIVMMSVEYFVGRYLQLHFQIGPGPAMQYTSYTSVKYSSQSLVNNLRLFQPVYVLDNVKSCESDFLINKMCSSSTCIFFNAQGQN